MKRLHHKTQASVSRCPRRRGAIFHYYMMYLFLSSILLTTAGLSLHLILKADRLDGQASQQLKTLLHLDRALRTDVAAMIASNGTIACQATQFQLKIPNAPVVQWNVEKNWIVRSEKDGETIISGNRFVFPKGTTFQFLQSPDETLVTLSVTEPAMVVKDNTSVSTAAAPHVVQIVVAVSAPERPPATATGGDAS